MRLDKGFIKPNAIIGFDTESARGEIISMQFSSHNGTDLVWCNTGNALRKFLEYLNKFRGYVVLYCFNAKFDLAIVFRQFIEMFCQDDFELDLGDGWQVRVFCSNNWFAIFKKGSTMVYFLDIAAYFKGSLDKVSKSFGLETSKMKRPEGLGWTRFTPKDEGFIEYAKTDAVLCREMGIQIVDMHAHYDIPISTSAANFAEKVFRRNFLHNRDVIKFPPFNARRMAELTYHGGKNAYYHNHPTYVQGCYEYDFNAAYGFSMYNLPTFLGGDYKRIRTFSDEYEGVYHISATIKNCPYGIAYDNRFHYIRDLDAPRRMRLFITSHELREGMRSREIEINKVHEGHIWIPHKGIRNPIREYIEEFWKLKNSSKKGTVQYEFHKLLLNSLYGKWIQRNPERQGGEDGRMDSNGRIRFHYKQEVSGGLYQPFIATLITGFTRARLHQEEHKLEAIEVSTDSVKSRKFVKEYATRKALGQMQMEHPFCKECEKNFDKFDALFVRNRLNLLMCPKGHVMKSALHGFIGKAEHLKQLWEENSNVYYVERMSQVREGVKQAKSGKKLFQMFEEERTLNVDWEQTTIIK